MDVVLALDGAPTHYILISTDSVSAVRWLATASSPCACLYQARVFMHHARHTYMDDFVLYMTHGCTHAHILEGYQNMCSCKGSLIFNRTLYTHMQVYMACDANVLKEGQAAGGVREEQAVRGAQSYVYAYMYVHMYVYII